MTSPSPQRLRFASPIEYDLSKARLECSFRWLLALILQQYIASTQSGAPESSFVRRVTPFVRDMHLIWASIEQNDPRAMEQVHIVLASGMLYLFGCEVVFHECPQTIEAYMASPKRTAHNSQFIALKWMKNRLWIVENPLTRIEVSPEQLAKAHPSFDSEAHESFLTALMKAHIESFQHSRIGKHMRANSLAAAGPPIDARDALWMYVTSLISAWGTYHPPSSSVLLPFDDLHDLTARHLWSVLIAYLPPLQGRDRDLQVLVGNDRVAIATCVIECLQREGFRVFVKREDLIDRGDLLQSVRECLLLMVFDAVETQKLLLNHHSPRVTSPVTSGASPSARFSGPRPLLVASGNDASSPLLSTSLTSTPGDLPRPRSLSAERAKRSSDGHASVIARQRQRLARIEEQWKAMTEAANNHSTASASSSLQEEDQIMSAEEPHTSSAPLRGSSSVRDSSQSRKVESNDELDDNHRISNKSPADLRTSQTRTSYDDLDDRPAVPATATPEVRTSSSRKSYESPSHVSASHLRQPRTSPSRRSQEYLDDSRVRTSTPAAELRTSPSRKSYESPNADLIVDGELRSSSSRKSYDGTDRNAMRSSSQNLRTSTSRRSWTEESSEPAAQPLRSSDANRLSWHDQPPLPTAEPAYDEEEEAAFRARRARYDNPPPPRYTSGLEEDEDELLRPLSDSSLHSDSASSPNASSLRPRARSHYDEAEELAMSERHRMLIEEAEAAYSDEPSASKSVDYYASKPSAQRTPSSARPRWDSTPVRHSSPQIVSQDTDNSYINVDEGEFAEEERGVHRSRASSAPSSPLHSSPARNSTSFHESPNRRAWDDNGDAATLSQSPVRQSVSRSGNAKTQQQSPVCSQSGALSSTKSSPVRQSSSSVSSSSGRAPSLSESQSRSQSDGNIRRSSSSQQVPAASSTPASPMRQQVRQDDSYDFVVSARPQGFYSDEEDSHQRFDVSGYDDDRVFHSGSSPEHEQFADDHHESPEHRPALHNNDDDDDVLHDADYREQDADLGPHEVGRSESAKTATLQVPVRDGSRRQPRPADSLVFSLRSQMANITAEQKRRESEVLKARHEAVLQFLREKKKQKKEIVRQSEMEQEGQVYSADARPSSSNRKPLVDEHREPEREQIPSPTNREESNGSSSARNVWATRKYALDDYQAPGHDERAAAQAFHEPQPYEEEEIPVEDELAWDNAFIREENERLESEFHDLQVKQHEEEARKMDEELGIAAPPATEEDAQTKKAVALVIANDESPSPQAVDFQSKIQSRAKASEDRRKKALEVARQKALVAQEKEKEREREREQQRSPPVKSPPSAGVPERLLARPSSAVAAKDKPKKIVVGTHSNKKLLKNALQHVCLAGAVNRAMLATVTEILEASDREVHYLVIREEEHPTYRALYALDPQRAIAERLHAVSDKSVPTVIEEGDWVGLFKYDSGAKRFRKVASNELGVGFDAIVLPMKRKV